MPKYIVYNNTLSGVKYLAYIVNKRPYFSTTMAAAKVCENKELAEFIAKQAYNYSGDNWKVQEVQVAVD